MQNLSEAVSLHLEGEDPAASGLAPQPTVIVTYELEPEHAQPSTALGLRGYRDTGTCRAIFRQASRFIAETDLRPHF
jgi:hypothetical protein